MLDELLITICITLNLIKTQQRHIQWREVIRAIYTRKNKTRLT